MAASRSNRTAATTPLARNIRLARKLAGKTQSDVAGALGLTDLMVISKWERAIYRPSEENLFAFAELVNRDVAWFYTDHSLERAA